MTVVRAPASTANLGPGFDVLGMALALYTQVSTRGDGPPCETSHPAALAFAAAGGVGDVWVRTQVPAARGLGFSGAARVAGAAAALVAGGVDLEEAREPALRVAAELEGHADNAAPSAYGGVVIATEDVVVPLPVALDADVVMWVPENETSTTSSRRTLPGEISRDDAVFNVGRVALLVTALLSGEHDLLADATQDRLHQPHRLERLPASARAIDDAVAAGAWGAWLSGSGPAVAALAASGTGDELAGALPSASARTLVLRIDHEGLALVGTPPDR